MNNITTKNSFSLAPKDFGEAMQFADILSKSNLVPKEFVNNPANILVAIQWGMELGLQPLQALQNIAIINGRPSLWGDAVIALVRSSPLCEYVIEETIDDKAVCRVKRRGEDEQLRIFSVADATKAGLVGKAGPWTQYPQRMLQMRARSWALRDVFPDVLRGMPVAEEVMDIEPRDITPSPSRPVPRQVEANAATQDVPSSPTLTREQITKVQEAADAAGVTTQEICEAGNVASLAEIRASSFDKLIRWIGEQKREPIKSNGGEEYVPA